MLTPARVLAAGMACEVPPASVGAGVNPVVASTGNETTLSTAISTDATEQAGAKEVRVDALLVRMAVARSG